MLVALHAGSALESQGSLKKFQNPADGSRREGLAIGGIFGWFLSLTRFQYATDVPGSYNSSMVSMLGFQVISAFSQPPSGAVVP